MDENIKQELEKTILEYVEMTDDEKIDFVAWEILKRYKEGFEDLAK
ncbi:MAG: hypothetical protein IJ004_04340 [Clostridia bacterium]|nr:hypothetical protein [Clostridia bacterium]